MTLLTQGIVFIIFCPLLNNQIEEYLLDSSPKSVTNTLKKASGAFALFFKSIEADNTKGILANLRAIESEALLTIEDQYRVFVCGGRFNLKPLNRKYYFDLISFFIFGLVNNFGYVVMLSATGHILGDEKKSESIVLLADILPSLIVKFSAPFILHKISYRIRIFITIIFGLLSFHLVGWGNSIGLRLFGVVVVSFCAGLGEATFLAMTTFYHRNTVSSWSSGTGAAGLFGALWYLALTVWIQNPPGYTQDIRPVISIVSASFFPILMAGAYFFLLSPIKQPRQEVSSDENQELLSDSLEESQDFLKEPNLTTKERLKLIPHLMWYIIPLVLVYLGEYLINQGVSPSLRWPDSPVSGAEYRYYQFLYQGGVFVSRSSVNLFRVYNIWWFPLFQILNLNLLILQALFHYMGKHYWIAFCIVIFEGFLGGATYVNVFYAISTETSGVTREFSMTATSVSDSVGIAGAALLGLWVGPLLKKINGII